MSGLIFTVLHLFCGLGGGALGFKRAGGEWRGVDGGYHNLAGIDCDEHACAAYEQLTGAAAVQRDLFSREDYIAYHGKEPPARWREMVPRDLRQIVGRDAPDVVFLSAPCKGFSGLLPKEQAASAKYQALNNLALRAVWLVLEAWPNNPPGVFLFENVPRIKQRGGQLLNQISQLLSHFGVAWQSANHDAGEIGGLGQHRYRFLGIGRNTKKIRPFIYEPMKRRLLTIGDVIGPLPLPDDPVCGPMHRMPRLKWMTWLRLALIRAGKDWKDLKGIESVELEHEPRGGVYRVAPWDQPASTVTTTEGVWRSNGVAAVADPRAKYNHAYRVTEWDETAGAVCSGHGPSSGATVVADPRMSEGSGLRANGYRIQRWDTPAHAITAVSAPVAGGPVIADPRVPDKEGRHSNHYRIQGWGQPANTVTGSTHVANGAQIVADPRLSDSPGRHSTKFRVQAWDASLTTVTGSDRVGSGSPVIADPRLNALPYNGIFGVLPWDHPASTVLASGDVHAGAAAVADPREGEAKQDYPIIISLDGTWHRPLTTLELAALQGLPLQDARGNWLHLPGRSDAKWRELIGNAVPPPAAQAMAETILLTLLCNAMRGTFMMGSTPVWVAVDSPRSPA